MSDFTGLDWFLTVVAIAIIGTLVTWGYKRWCAVRSTPLPIRYYTRHIDWDIPSYCRHRLARFQYDPNTNLVTITYHHRRARVEVGRITDPFTGYVHTCETPDDVVDLLLGWVEQMVEYAHSNNTRTLRWHQSRTELVMLLSSVVWAERDYLRSDSHMSQKAIRWYHDALEWELTDDWGHIVHYRDHVYHISPDQFDEEVYMGSVPHSSTMDSMIHHVMTCVNKGDRFEVYGNTPLANLLADIYDDELARKEDRLLYIKTQREMERKRKEEERDSQHANFSDDWDPPIPTHIALGVAAMYQDTPRSSSEDSRSSYTSDSSSSDSSSCD